MATDIKKRSARGGGSVYRKEGTKFYTMKYKGPDGKNVYEPSGTDQKGVAQARLRARVVAVRDGKPAYTPDRNAVKVQDLFTSLVAHTELRSEGKRSVEGLSWRWQHLEPVFGDVPAAKVTFASIERYQARRKQEGAANATINRETAMLRKMFNLRRKHDKSLVTPHHDPLPENNTRQGFIEDAQFDKLAAEAKELWLRTFLELAYTYGWRRSELLDLRVRQVDLTAHTIRLDPGTTKNGEGREVTTTPKVEDLLRMAVAGKHYNDYVLTREDGRQVKEFRAAWKALFERAGVDLRTVHDFRRSSAKAWRRAGVPESVIMATGGWKTASMFRRYAIVSSADQREAVAMLEAARARKTDKLPLSSFEAKTETAEQPKIN